MTRSALALRLAFPEFSLTPLRQRYHRISLTTYEYSAPDLAFAARLTVGQDGFVQDSPGLWRAEI